MLLHHAARGGRGGSSQRSDCQLVFHSAHRRVLAVLDFDPVFRPSGAIAAVRTLRHQTLKSHVARRPEQVGADLTLLEGCREDAVGAAGEQAREVGLAHGERQAAWDPLFGLDKRARLGAPRAVLRLPDTRQRL
jgi:hypothetical protein